MVKATPARRKCCLLSCRSTQCSPRKGAKQLDCHIHNFIWETTIGDQAHSKNHRSSFHSQILVIAPGPVTLFSVRKALITLLPLKTFQQPSIIQNQYLQEPVYTTRRIWNTIDRENPPKSTSVANLTSCISLGHLKTTLLRPQKPYASPGLAARRLQMQCVPLR